jgi:hypothetical protein
MSVSRRNGLYLKSRAFKGSRSGAEIDAQTYLQKFIHLTLHLVDDKQSPHERVTTRFIEYLVKALEFKPEQQDLVRNTVQLVRHVAENRNLSLRAIEQIMTLLSLALAYKPDRTFCPAAILAGLCILKVTDPDLHVKAKLGTITFEEIRVPLGFHDAKADEQSEHAVTRSTLFWRYCTDPGWRPDDPIHSEFGGMMTQYSIERQRVVPHVANSIVDRLVAR